MQFDARAAKRPQPGAHLTIDDPRHLRTAREVGLASRRSFLSAGAAALLSPSLVAAAAAQAGSAVKGARSQALSPRVSVRRSSGAAPLSVHFDATQTTSPSTNDSYRDLWYLWDFGETKGPGAARWKLGANAGMSRNQAVGPIAAHLYELPGRYIAQLLVIDRTSGATAVETVAVSVADPDEVYAGRTMSYVNSGAPSDSQVVTSSWDEVVATINAKGNGWRHRLRGGDTFEMEKPSSESVNNIRPSHLLIESFGRAEAVLGRTGAAADSTCTTIIFGHRRSQAQTGNVVKDIRVDCTANAPGQKGVAVGQYAGTDLTLVRVTAKACQMLYANSLHTEGYNASPDRAAHGHGGFDGLAVWDCQVTDVAETATGKKPYAMFVGCNHGSIQGCKFDLDAGNNNSISHVLRMWHGYKTVIANNFLRGSGTTQHCLKLHARTAAEIAAVRRDPRTPPWGTAGDSGGWTRFVWIAANHIVATYTNTPVGIGAPSGGAFPDSGTQLEKIAFVGNFLDAGPNATVQIGLGYWAHSGLIALNVFRFASSSAMRSVCVHLGKRSEAFGSDGPLLQVATDVKVWGNSAFTRTPASNRCMFASVSNQSVDVELRNNAFWAPNDKGAVVASGCNKPADQADTRVPITAAGYSAANNSTEAQCRQSHSPFASAAPASLADFAPAARSYLRQSGAGLRLPREAAAAARASARPDIGAVQAD